MIFLIGVVVITSVSAWWCLRQMKRANPDRWAADQQALKDFHQRYETAVRGTCNA